MYSCEYCVYVRYRTPDQQNQKLPSILDAIKSDKAEETPLGVVMLAAQPTPRQFSKPESPMSNVQCVNYGSTELIPCKILIVSRWSA